MAELKGKPAALTTRLPGKATTEPTAAQCASVGEFLARMHLAGVDFAPFQPHLRGIGWWKSAVPKLKSHVPDEVMRVLTEELIFQDSFFRSPRFEKLPAARRRVEQQGITVLLPAVGRNVRCERKSPEISTPRSRHASPHRERATSTSAPRFSTSRYHADAAETARNRHRPGACARGTPRRSHTARRSGRSWPYPASA